MDNKSLRSCVVAGLATLAALCQAQSTVFRGGTAQIHKLTVLSTKTTFIHLDFKRGLVAMASQGDLPKSVGRSQRAEVAKIVALLRQSKTREATVAWKGFCTEFAQANMTRGSSAVGDDVGSIVQLVLRESYLESTNDLRDMADKVKYFNDMKKALREQISSLRSTSQGMRRGQRATITLVNVDRQYKPGAKGVTDGRRAVYTREQIDSYVNRLNTDLETVGDDAQMQQLQLQQMLEKRQQLMQTISNICKVMNDSAKSIINNMK
ncbi:MAG TPA: hypothetical protein VNI20_13730 [Fimbriimonadaceae bacterium]|nr:hypothetical protein [Fimbriimonadaceae bacterium]